MSVEKQQSLKEKIQELGISPTNMTACIVIHEMIGMSLFFGSWICCYQILKRPVLKIRIEKWLQNYNQQQQQYSWQQYLQKLRGPAEAKAQKWTKQLPKVFVHDCQLKVLAGINSIIIRKICAPVLVPFKIYASLQLTLYFVGKQPS